MGLEAACAVRFGKQASDGKARLEATELLFRGDFRLRIALKDVASVQAKRGNLVVVWPEGQATFAIGKDAEKWALRVRTPRSLLDKLGVKAGSRVAVVGSFPGDFLKDLAGRTGQVTRGMPGKDSDLVFVAMGDSRDLAQLQGIREAIQPAGGIWVVWPKGKKVFREDHVRAAGPAVGLVDVKVVSFSDRLSGLKMVIPVAQRKRKG